MLSQDLWATTGNCTYPCPSVAGLWYNEIKDLFSEVTIETVSYWSGREGRTGPHLPEERRYLRFRFEVSCDHVRDWYFRRLGGSYGLLDGDTETFNKTLGEQLVDLHYGELYTT